MNSTVTALTSILASILLLGLFIKFQHDSVVHRRRYIEVLCDLNEKIFKLVEAGTKLVEADIKQHDSTDVATPESLETVFILAALANIIAEINKECIRTKMNIFFRENDPEARCKKRYAKYLDVLNQAHKKFESYLVA